MGAAAQPFTNEHHFGCRIDAGRPGAARRIAELFDKAMYFAPDVLASEEMLLAAGVHALAGVGTVSDVIKYSISVEHRAT